MAARSIHKLTPERVRHAQKKIGLHSDGGGLYLRVKSKKAASWVFRYMLDGKAREMGLGSYPAITLPAAREKASELRTVKAGRQDPIQVRQAQRQARRLQEARGMTFRQCAEAYIAAHQAGWKNPKHGALWTATLETYAFPTFGDLPVGAVDRALVIRVLEPIWTTKPETASRVRGRIEAVLDWAEARDYRTGDNPARWKGSLDKLFPKRSKVRSVRHHPALAYDQMPAFMATLRAQDWLAAEALQFTILTAVRTSEALCTTWDEFDLDKATWTVPAVRTKTGRDHRVPLSDQAVTLLRGRHRATNGEGYIFPGQRASRPLSNMAMLKVLERMGRDDLTVHGFRSTFRDWAEEMTNFAGSVAEAALGHVVGDKVEAAYRRGDLFEKRRKLMEAWAAFCCSPATAGEVIPIRKMVL
jgi:integrase